MNSKTSTDPNVVALYTKMDKLCDGLSDEVVLKVTHGEHRVKRSWNKNFDYVVDVGIPKINPNYIGSSNYKESITNMVNKVRIYDGEGKPQGVVQNDADVKKYGIFQQTYTKEEGKDATTTAKSMFKTVEKTFTLECVNLNEAVTGAGAVVRDSSTGLSGVVWIDADTHTWQNGVATMSLTVTLKQMMDTKEG